MSLGPIAMSEEARYVSEMGWACISIAKLNKGGFVRQVAPDLYEVVRDKLLVGLQGVVQDPEKLSFLGDTEYQVVNALALARGDEEVVTEGLIKVVHHAAEGGSLLSNTQSVVNNCLRAIGALGHESGREMLEYWQSRGNVSAQAALEAFGESMEAIKDREKAIRAERKAKREEEEKEKLKENKCFIATAVYGSAAAPDVVILRELRDLRLKQTQIGCLIVRAYERWSPALAQAIVRHPLAGRTMRWLIVAPVAWITRGLLTKEIDKTGGK
jgi:hypothetical protein